MKKILIVEVLIAIVLVSIGIVTASNFLTTNEVTNENGKECICLHDCQGNCILDNNGNCICEGQCPIKDCCNQNTNSKSSITIDNSNGCCKRN